MNSSNALQETFVTQIRNLVIIIKLLSLNKIGLFKRKHFKNHSLLKFICNFFLYYQNTPYKFCEPTLPLYIQIHISLTISVIYNFLISHNLLQQN